MGRRVAPFYYFEGDTPEALSRHMPSLRRRQILWMSAPALMLLPCLAMLNPASAGGLAWCLLLAAAFVVAGLRLFNDIVVSPLEDLGQAAGRLGEGDYSALLDVTSGDALGVATNRFNKALRKTDRRFFVREHFGHMVSPDKSEALFEGGLKLDGEEREVAVLCCRIGGTGLNLPVFNKFCTLVVECVEKHGGGIDEVSHGLVTAIFNAPLTIANPEGEAIQAAQEIKERLAVFQSQQRMQAGLSLDCNLGLAYGQAILGLVGPKGRQRYTALGPVPEEALKRSRL
jgi:adenylate cyclase